MPLETGSALPLTLPAIPLFSKATRSQTPFQDSLLFVQLSCTIGKRCQPSKDLWEDLKPFIRQVYVEENKTLQQLAEFLRDEHDFFPTDKQLTKRLRDWGFRKNISRKERSIIEKLDCSTNEPRVRTPNRKTSKKNPKGLKKEMTRLERAKTAENSTSPVLWTSPTSPAKPEFQSFDPGDEAEGLQSLPKREGEKYNRVPFESLLFRLFVAIKVQPPDDISKLRLKSSDFGTKKVKRQYLSTTDIRKLTTGDLSNDLYLEQTQQSPGWTYEGNDNCKGNAPLKIPDMDVLFPSDIQVAPNPFMELYPFPISSVKAIQTDSACKSRFVTCQNEVAEYKDKFTKLKQLCPETHPAMISIMEKLGSAYYQLGKASQAEHWYRSAVAARQQTDEAMSLRLLYAWLGVIDATNAQGRFIEAKILYEKIHPLILRAVDPDHSIVQKSLQIIAIILGNLGNHEDAEAHCRQLLQIRLNTFGLRHGKTIAALQRLSNPIRRQERYSESEELLSIMVQLSESAPGMSDHRRCRGLSSLAKVMFQQGRYKASESLHRQATEWSKLSLGEEHPATMQCVYHLARTLRCQGDLRESEDLLRQTVERQTKTLGEYSPSTIDSTSELGETLEMAGRYDEAIVIYEKSLRGFSMIWGPGHDYTIVGCESLGRCYELKCRYTDALALYGRTIDDIQAAHGPSHEAIAEIHGWIHKACELWSSQNQ